LIHEVSEGSGLEEVGNTNWGKGEDGEIQVHLLFHEDYRVTIPLGSLFSGFSAWRGRGKGGDDITIANSIDFLQSISPIWLIVVPDMAHSRACWAESIMECGGKRSINNNHSPAYKLTCTGRKDDHIDSSIVLKPRFKVR
jgi:hypothetical protein